ncbi:MAG: gamma-glutamyltransferase family protein, partial [Candidatus Tectomicrobia bacterium]|nr:gamma-glutamyltransferase family protein [Candidatus Tectomicrobia bacterium]
RQHLGGRIGRGVHRCVMPAALDAWLTALERHGTMTFTEVVTPALELAEVGFPMHDVMLSTMATPSALEAMRQWPSTRTIFLPDGDLIPLGARVVQKDLAHTLRLLIEAEQGATSRVAGLHAVRARFYQGDIAEQMVRFVQQQGGWLTMEDLATFHVSVEAPVKTTYRGYEVYACGPWCQGPVVPQTLNILEGYDLAAMDRFSPAVYHLILEALKAAFADRDRYYGDPRHVAVPMDGLLSKAYAAEWRSRIDPQVASPGMPEPGDAWRFSAHQPHQPSRWRFPTPSSGPVEPDTSYVAVVDRWGNAFSATPSDGVTNTPVVPGLGFIISSRGMQSWLDPDHPSCLAPGKRPRLTPSPGMVLKDGRLVMPYGTPGNDVQPQAMVQYLMNVLDYGMNPQQAIEAPRCATMSFPRSSDPHPYTPGLAHLEARLDASVAAELTRMGHQLHLWPDWAKGAGSVGAVQVDHEHGVLHGVADVRRVAYAMGR